MTREERVQAHFPDGRTIEGLIQMELREDLNRAAAPVAANLLNARSPG